MMLRLLALSLLMSAGSVVASSEEAGHCVGTACQQPRPTAAPSDDEQRNISESKFPGVQNVTATRYIPCEPGSGVAGVKDAGHTESFGKNKIVYALVQIDDVETSSWKVATGTGQDRLRCAFVYTNEKGQPISILDETTSEAVQRNQESWVLGSMLGYTGKDALKQFVLLPGGLALIKPCLFDKLSITSRGVSSDGKKVTHRFDLEGGQLIRSFSYRTASED